ncbi:MAG: hypothetical protein ACYDEP_12735 [Acidimicrobiales bacterium]
MLRSQSGGLVFSVHLVPGRLDSGTFARHVSGTGTYNSFDHGVALRLSRTPCKGDGTPVRENTACSGEDAASLKRGHVTVAHLQGVVQGELITASTTTGPRLHNASRRFTHNNWGDAAFLQDMIATGVFDWDHFEGKR